MGKLLHTIWPFLLNVFGLRIFRTCFDNAMEDEDRECLLRGPPFSSFFFSVGVYMIIVNSTLFPRAFRQPKIAFLVMYEFLATAFLLEFSTACIWTPIDVFLMTTLPTSISHALYRLELKDAAAMVLNNMSLMAPVTYTVAITFFLLTLHVTSSVDFTIIRDCGVSHFLPHATKKLYRRLQKELPFLHEETKPCRCKIRRKSPSRSRDDINSKYY